MIISLILVLLNCSLIGCQVNSLCCRNVLVGGNEICLPKYSDYYECYLEENVKNYADQFEFPGNSTLALYLNSETYQHRDYLENIVFDNYIKFYIYNMIADNDANKADLDLIVKTFSDNYKSNNWDGLKETLEESLPFVNFDFPTLFSEYSLNDQSRTYLLLQKMEINGKEIYMGIASNVILINNRIIFMAYYLFDVTSFARLEVLRILNEFFINELYRVN